MKTIRWALALLGLGLVASGSAWADRGYHHGGHAHIGIIIGGPVWDPWPWYYRPYYPPPVVVVPAPAPPPVYVEQGGGYAAPVEPAYWYYCPHARAYYPYVKDCPSGWQKVVPQAPPQ